LVTRDNRAREQRVIGQTIDDRYQIETLLGRGGMGAVYQATDLVENRIVALKFLDLYRGGQTEMVLTRFQREFRVLSRLRHPRILQAYEVGTFERTPYLVLEFLAGSTLTDAMATAPLPRARSLQIAGQICEPLAYLHRQSIVHRDLKPDNLMLMAGQRDATDLNLKLMDFGLVHQADLSLQLTEEGTVLGTIAYMAPEQAQGFPVDFRADLYALGAILYQMVTGQLPFPMDNPAMMVMQLLMSDPPAPRQHNPQVDEPLERLIMHLLAKEPSERPQNTDWVATQLAQLTNQTVAALSSSTEATAGPGRIDLIPRVPLIGRQAAVAALLQYWTQAQTEQGQVVLVSGVAGVGKTRFLEEIKPQMRLAQGRMVRSHCQDQAALPYQPIVDILDNLLSHLPDKIRENLPVELARLLPGASYEAPGDLDRSDQADARRRLFNACWAVIKQATEKQPLHLVIENLQWVDPASQELLDYLIEQVGQTRLLLTLTYRPEEFDPTTSLAVLRRDLGRQERVPTITLDLLTRAQTARFLQSALGGKEIPAWLIDSFQQTTDGNPLFLEETLKALAAEGQVAAWIKQESSQWTRPTTLALQLPQNVLAVAERRLQPLATEDRNIMLMAAVLGPEFSFALLQAIVKLDEDALLDVIDRLLAARLIEELPLQAGEDRFRFAQDALRQALLHTTSQRRIRRLHQQAGEAIERIYDAGQRRYWPVLAHHFTQAGDAERAIKYSQLAGDAAAAVYANVEAAAYYRQVLTLFDAAEAGTQWLTDLYSRLGRVLELNSQFDEALEVYAELETLAQQRGSRSMELAALMAQGTIMSFALRDFIRAEALMNKALSLARDLGDQAAEAKVSWGLSNVHTLQNRFETAIEYGERSLALSRQLNLRQQMVYTLNDLARTYVFYGRFNQAQEMAREARQLWRDMENRPMLADNLSQASIIALHLGYYDQAVAYSEEALQISQATNNNWGQSYSRMWVGVAYWEYGQSAEAIAVSVDGIRLGDLVGFVGARIVTRAELALIYAELGAPERGLELIEQALDIVGTSAQFEFHRPIILAAKTQIQLSHGNLAGAETAITQAKPDPHQPELSIFVPPVFLARGELAFRQKEYARTAAVMDELLDTLNNYGMRRYLPDGLYLQAQAFRKLGQLETAQARLGEAQAVAEAIGSRRILWRVLFTLSQLEPDPIQAKRLHQQAQEVVEYIADHAPADLRASFLALPNVAAIFEPPPRTDNGN
jgi:predicted ATPase/tRNA A-37 threonylcarbamoyl transferase component Bud32